MAGLVAKWVSDHAAARLLQEHKGKLDSALETHKAALGKDAEAYKLSLKRQELIFQREVEAGDALMKLWRVIYPAYRFPDMDWHDACEDVAAELGSVEKAIGEYIEKHGVAVSSEVLRLLEQAHGDAAVGKFSVLEDGEAQPGSAVQAAEAVLDALKQAREQMLADLRR